MTEDYKVGHLYPLMLNDSKDGKWGIPVDCGPLLCVAIDILHKTATFLAVSGTYFARDGVTPFMYDYNMVDEEGRTTINAYLNEDEIGAPLNAWTCGTMFFVGHEEIKTCPPPYNWWEEGAFVLEGFEDEFDED